MHYGAPQQSCFTPFFIAHLQIPPRPRGFLFFANSPGRHKKVGETQAQSKFLSGRAGFFFYTQFAIFSSAAASSSSFGARVLQDPQNLAWKSTMDTVDRAMSCLNSSSVVSSVMGIPLQIQAAIAGNFQAII